MARKAMPWFRFYAEAPSDRKVRRLKRPDHKWVWVCCLCLARQSPLPGFLLISERESVTVNDLADLAGMAEPAVTKAIAAMQQIGLLARDDMLGAWFIPAWDSRQYPSDTSTDRVRAHRQRTNGTPMKRSKPVPETAEETGRNGGRNAPETETETEQMNPTCSPSLRVVDNPSAVDNA